MSTRLTGLSLATLFAVLAAGGCSSDSNAPDTPSGNTVTATPSQTFTPGTLSVSAGETVTFIFGSLAHNVFFDVHAGAPADIPGNNANKSVDRAFASAGTYTYTCHIHPQMHGTIIVQ
jgi:plastocyanin